jgi:hypothetical protein
MNRGIADDRKASLITRGSALGYTTFEEMMMTKKEIPQKPLTREQVKHAKLRIEQVAARKVNALGRRTSGAATPPSNSWSRSCVRGASP